MMPVEGVNNMLGVFMSALICAPFPIPIPGASMATIFGIEGDEAWLRVAEEIKNQPIAVTAPGFDSIGYGMFSNGMYIEVFRFNSLLESSTRDMREAELTPESVNEMSFMVGWMDESLTPNRGEAVEWALTELASRGAIPYPESGGISWQEWVTLAKAEEGQYDPQAVVDTLIEWGMPHLIMQVER
jgi:hypothetical protein